MLRRLPLMMMGWSLLGRGAGGGRCKCDGGCGCDGRARRAAAMRRVHGRWRLMVMVMRREWLRQTECRAAAAMQAGTRWRIEPGGSESGKAQKRLSWSASAAEAEANRHIHTVALERRGRCQVALLGAVVACVL